LFTQIDNLQIFNSLKQKIRVENITHLVRKKIILLYFLALPFLGFSQHFTVTLDNFMSTSDTFEVDVILTINTPAEGVRLCGVTTGINYNPAILNGGTPCTTSSNSGCDSWILVPGTIAPELTANGGLNTIVTMNRDNPGGHLRIVQTAKTNSLVDLVAGSYRVGRFRFTNTVSWAVDSNPELWLSNTNALGATNTIVWSAPFGTSTFVRAATTTTAPHYVTLGYTQGSPLPMLRLLNSSLATVSNNSVSEIVTTFPNPFQNTFKLDMNKVSGEPIQVSVYDLLGKQIEVFNVETNETNTLEIGQSYPSGFYNLKVSQGDKSQSIKMIKQ
jgi:hypothetical protein